MEKPFDTKELLKLLKNEGLPLFEADVQMVEKCLMQWLKESIVLSDSKMDDFALPILEVLQPLIEAQIAKIDGK